MDLIHLRFSTLVVNPRPSERPALPQSSCWKNHTPRRLGTQRYPLQVTTALWQTTFLRGMKTFVGGWATERRNSLMNHPWDAKEGKWGGSWKWDWNTQKKNRLIEGSLEVKLPTIWTDEKQTRAEAERSEKIRKEKSRRERLRRKKMQMREKVGKPRNSVFFQWFEAPEGPVFHDLDYCGGNRHCCTRRRRRERTTPLKLKGAPESLECIG